MNKKTLLSIFTGFLLLAGVLLMNINNNSRAYAPRVEAAQGIAGYEAYLKSIRANQRTGEVTNEEVALVRAEVKRESSKKFKADWPLKWSFRGPDNIGGRTRCLVIDKDEPTTLYTGGVSGKVYKSTNSGGSWYPLTQGDDVYGVVSMAQATDGAIYYGTGESGLGVSATGAERVTGSWNGDGMYKSTDGETFTLLPTTVNHGNIYVLTAHPTENVIFSGSSNGLRMTDDGGATWTTLRSGACRDIQINSDGVALAYVGTSIWRSTTPKDGGSYTLIQGFASNRRSAIAWSKSDPNYCYVVSAGAVTFDGRSYDDALVGFYKSTDAGETFVKEVGELSQFFSPFSSIGATSQGAYDMAIGVHPRNKDRVFIGGIGFAEWTLEQGPRLVGNNFNSPLNPFGLHSDKHLIKFDDSGEDPLMYVCTDGGVSVTTNSDLNNYKDLFNGLSSTQFFAIAAGTNGRLIGGTQDNNTILLTGEGFPRQKGFDVIGGDGFQSAISKFDPNYMWGESQWSNLRRSEVGGTEMVSIWDNRIRSAFSSATQPSNSFNAPMCLWENPSVIERREITGPEEGDDTLVNARLYLTMDDGVWMCKNALSKLHDGSNPKDEGAIRWFKVSSLTNIHHLEVSPDGESLYVGTGNGRLHRVNNLISTQFDTTSIPADNGIAAGLTEELLSSNLVANGRAVTSLAIDNNNADRAVLTLGNFSNNNYVFITEDLSASNPTWTSIQGNLPKFPVYHAIISVDDPDVIILATEFGMWATSNGTSATPTWAQAHDGVDGDKPFPVVPVFDVVQVENKSWTGPRVYAGTHGMGIWESKSLLTSVPKENKAPTSSVSLFPNPVHTYVNVSSSIKGSTSINIYNLSGQVVLSTPSNNGTTRINTAELANGSYFVEVAGSADKAVSKIIVQH